MNLRENTIMAIQGLLANKMRALLTMLGIIIGIGSVIAITSVGNAMTGVMNNAFSSFGITNIQVTIQPRDYNSNSAYKQEDLISNDMLAKFRNRFGDKISAIGLSASAGSGEIKQGRKKAQVTISGVNDGGLQANNITMKQGRFISEKDDTSSKYVAVISERLVSTLYSPSQNPIGQKIRMNTSYGVKTFTVVGVFQEAASSMFIRQNTKTTFYIPVTTAKRLSNEGDYYSSIMVTAKMGTDCTKFSDDIDTYFNNTFYDKNKDLRCRSFSLEAEMSQANAAMGTLSLAISVIAAISLLVGGIGVMNIMLVSVTERTREIGVRKALGAPDSAIRVQFIVESMIICLIGGVFGILLGTGLGGIGGILLKANAAPTLSGVVVAVGFSMAIGVFFGFYPANKAAKLDPIEALRYE
jgi:putative ABC transport system permease protein